MKRITLLYVVLLTFLVSCSKKELGSEEVQDCTSINCTFELRWISVKLVDHLGKPVALDRIKVTRVADGKDLTRTYDSNQWAASRRLGSYPLTSDLDDDQIPRFKHSKLRFQGYVGSREVVKADYVVTFNCCHIMLISGKVELVVGR